MKRILSLLVSLCLLCSLLAGCGSKTAADTSAPKTVTFTDSLGRAVEVPAQIDHVAVTGPMTQQVIFALCPDKLVGIATALAIDPALPRAWAEGQCPAPQLKPISWSNKALASSAHMAAVKFQLTRLSQGRKPAPSVSPLRALIGGQIDSARRARQYRKWIAGRG